MMIGKTRSLTFTSLFFLLVISLIVNSYIFNSLLIINIFLISSLISLVITKYGFKIITRLNLLQNIRTEGPSLHFNKTNTPTALKNNWFLRSVSVVKRSTCPIACEGI